MIESRELNIPENIGKRLNEQSERDRDALRERMQQNLERDPSLKDVSRQELERTLRMQIANMQLFKLDPEDEAELERDPLTQGARARHEKYKEDTIKQIIGEIKEYTK